MAENVKKSYFEILDELFVGPSAALSKYAKVRFVQYEMQLWRKYGLPLKEVNPKAKRYFSVCCLGQKTRIDKASPKELSAAFEKLHFAVGKDPSDPLLYTGCHKKCLRLLNELNASLFSNGLEIITDVEKFLDWLTFDYEVRRDENGEAIFEKPYNFEVRIFHNEQNRREFLAVLKMLKSEKREMSMQDVWRIVNFKRKQSKPSK